MGLYVFQGFLESCQLFKLEAYDSKKTSKAGTNDNSKDFSREYKNQSLISLKKS